MNSPTCASITCHARTVMPTRCCAGSMRRSYGLMHNPATEVYYHCRECGRASRSTTNRRCWHAGNGFRSIGQAGAWLPAVRPVFPLGWDSAGGTLEKWKEAHDDTAT